VPTLPAVALPDSDCVAFARIEGTTALARFETITGAGLRKISRNIPGVKIDNGFTLTCGSAAVPLSA